MLSNQFGLCQNCTTVWRKICFLREIIGTKKPKQLLLPVRNIYFFLFVYRMRPILITITSSSISIVHSFSLSIVTHVSSIVCLRIIKKKKVFYEKHLFHLYKKSFRSFLSFTIEDFIARNHSINKMCQNSLICLIKR